MENYIRDIINNNYDNEFVRSKLYRITPKIIEYFGDNSLKLVIEAFRNIDICVCPSTLDMDKFINNRLNLTIDNYYNNYLNKDLINTSSGISYSISADIAFNTNTNEFVNKGFDRKILFIKEQFKDPFNKKDSFKASDEHMTKLIIHEIIRQMKSINQNNVIRNGKRLSRCGVHKIYNSINKKNSDITLQFLSESGKGFNEASLEFDTIMIFTSIYGYEPELCAFPLEVEMYKRIIKDNDLLLSIHKYEFNGDIISLRTIFDSKTYDGAFDYAISLEDKIIHSAYIKDEETFNSLRDEIMTYIKSLKSDNKENMPKNEYRK